MDSTQAFLQSFERQRLRIEDLVIHMPESAKFLTQFSASPEYYPQEHIRAVPILGATLTPLLYAQRTTDTVSQKLARAGSPPSLQAANVGRILMCYAAAHLYRLAAKATGSPQFAKQFSTVFVLATLDYQALEQVDWVVKAINRSRHGASQDWLAPALLFTVWATNLESPSKARQIAGFLDQLGTYVETVMQYAVRNEVYMQYPW